MFKSILLLAIILGMCEIFLRVFIPSSVAIDRHTRLRNIFQFENTNIQIDNEVTYTIKPNLTKPFYNDEFVTTVSTNSMGFRDDNASLNNPKILILSDSFGFGWGVNQEQVCERILENICNIKVLNMSIPGYSTVQEFFLLRKWCINNKLDGNIIIFLFNEGDLDDNLGYEIDMFPTIEVENGMVKFSKPNIDKFKKICYAYNFTPSKVIKTIRKNSYIIDLSWALLYRLKQKLAYILLPTLVTDKEKYAHNKMVNNTKKYKNFDLLIKEIAYFAKQEKSKVIFVYIPTDLHFYGYGENIQFSEVKTILSKSYIPLIDLRNILYDSDCYKYDRHWRASGHYKTAMEIKKFLVENHLLSLPGQ